MKGRADINALLTQLVQENDLTAEIVNNYRKLADEYTLDIDNLSYCATYVPIETALNMGSDNSRDVFWDDDDPVKKRSMTPCFPSNLYPVQSCNQYGNIPHTLLIFQLKGDSSQDTSMLWLLCGLLTQIQKLWTLVYNIQLYQSQWHGWLLTYI